MLSCLLLPSVPLIRAPRNAAARRGGARNEAGDGDVRRRHSFSFFPTPEFDETFLPLSRREGCLLAFAFAQDDLDKDRLIDQCACAARRFVRR